MDNELEINLQVDGTYYPLRIERDREFLYRAAARSINSILGRYRAKFPNLSNEKYYTMVAIHIATANEMWKSFNDTLPYKDKIRQLSNEIERFLDEGIVEE